MFKREKLKRKTSMQKILKKAIFMGIMISVCNPIKSHEWFEHPEEHWKGIATVALAVGGSVGGVVCYWWRGKNYTAENLEKERLKQEQDRKIELEKKRDNAMSYVHRINTRYEKAFSYLKEHGTMTKEIAEETALQLHADQTPFYHIRTGKKLRKVAEKLSSLRNLLSESEGKKVEKRIMWLQVMRDANSRYFKNDLAVELHTKKEAKQQQQIFDLKKAAKEEKLKRKKTLTKASEESLNAIHRAKNATESFIHQAHSVLNSVLNRSQETHAVILNEFNKHGWNAMAQNFNGLAQRVNSLESSIIRGQKISSEKKEKHAHEIKKLKDDMEALLAVCTQLNVTGELKKEIESIKATFNQRLSNLEVTLATHTVTLDDIKTIVSVPSAPPVGY
jgi:hypothetical protein